MRILLKRPTQINHAAGEIVEVSPAQARFLTSVGAAETVAEKPKPKKPKGTNEQ